MSLPQTDPGSGSDIPFVHVEELLCLNCRHRVEAAKRWLREGEKWWTIKLLANEHDLSRNECVRTSEEHRNEEGHPSGEVFRKIRLYHLLNDGQCERRWWARLSKSQSKDLKQLIRDERYATAFDRLLPWPGLWYSVQLGSLRRLLAMRCHDECLNYLSQIAEMWAYIFSDTSGETLYETADVETVHQLQTLIPAMSRTDAHVVRASMECGTLFPAVTKDHDRHTILQNLLRIRVTIPSLHTFFEDLKFLEPGSKVLRSLVAPSGANSLRDSLFASYHQTSALTIEYGVCDRRTRPQGPFKQDRELAYQQLWLFALRNFHHLTEFAPRKEIGSTRQTALKPNPVVQQKLGELAWRLGFQTDTVRALSFQDASIDLAHRILRSFTLDDTKHQQAAYKIANVLRSLNSATKARPSPPSSSSACWLPPNRRCGRPYESDHQHDQPFMFLPLIYVRSNEKSEEISSWHRKCFLFWKFFTRIGHVEFESKQEEPACGSTVLQSELLDGIPPRSRSLEKTSSKSIHSPSVLLTRHLGSMSNFQLRSIGARSTSYVPAARHDSPAYHHAGSITQSGLDSCTRPDTHVVLDLLSESPGACKVSCTNHEFDNVGEMPTVVMSPKYTEIRKNSNSSQPLTQGDNAHSQRLQKQPANRLQAQEIQVKEYLLIDAQSEGVMSIAKAQSGDIGTAGVPSQAQVITERIYANHTKDRKQNMNAAVLPACRSKRSLQRIANNDSDQCNRATWVRNYSSRGTKRLKLCHDNQVNPNVRTESWNVHKGRLPTRSDGQSDATGGSLVVQSVPRIEDKMEEDDFTSTEDEEL